MVVVPMTDGEWMVAQALGFLRQKRALERGQRDRFGLRRDDTGGEAKHVLGAYGELAAAKALNVYPGFTEGIGAAADLGRGIAVRTRGRPDYELLVRPSDPGERVYVFARVLRPFVFDESAGPPEIEVVGALPGSEAKRPEWRRYHGGRDGAYFVPDDALRPLDSFDWRAL